MSKVPESFWKLASAMVAFCRNNSANLTNISFCRDCYKALLQEPIRRLADAACVEWLGVEDDDEG